MIICISKKGRVFAPHHVRLARIDHYAAAAHGVLDRVDAAVEPQRELAATCVDIREICT